MEQWLLQRLASCIRCDLELHWHAVATGACTLVGNTASNVRVASSHPANVPTCESEARGAADLGTGVPRRSRS